MLRVKPEGRGDDDSVEVLPIKQRAIVGDGGNLVSAGLVELGEARLVDVCGRGYFDTGDTKEAANQFVAAAAGADDSDPKRGVVSGAGNLPGGFGIGFRRLGECGFSNKSGCRGNGGREATDEQAAVNHEDGILFRAVEDASQGSPVQFIAVQDGPEGGSLNLSACVPGMEASS